MTNLNYFKQPLHVIELHNQMIQSRNESIIFKNICRITEGNQKTANNSFETISISHLNNLIVSRTAMLLVRQSPRSEPSVRRFQPEGRHASSDLRT
jgi:hypothetical protein